MPAVLLARELIAVTRAQRAASLVTAVVGAAVCLLVLATTGQTATTEASVLATVDQAGSRTLVVQDPEGAAGLMAHGLDAVARLDGVDWILALGPAYDVRAAALGSAAPPVTARAFYTPLPPALVHHSGRAPEPGEALVGIGAQRLLGLTQAAGALDAGHDQLGAVGSFRARDPLGDLDDTVLTRGAPGPDAPVRTLYVVARDITDVAPLEAVLPGMLVLKNQPGHLVVSSPTELAQLQRVVGGELGKGSRRVMVGVLLGGLVLICTTMIGATLARRRDFGRRRAMGASRGHLLVFVVAQAGISVAVGATVGTLLGMGALGFVRGELPAWSFCLAVPVLTVIVGLLAALPPAVYAAWRDPVLVLRTP